TFRSPGTAAKHGRHHLWRPAPASKRIAPSTISTNPGQFDLSPNPPPGRLGSRVTPGTAERDRLGSLSRPRQIAWAAMKSTPLTTSSAPSQMTSILVSPVLQLASLSEPLRCERPEDSGKQRQNR